MSLGGIISDAASAALGTSGARKTDLKGFLAKFSDSSGKHVNQLNPLNTFEVSFKFHPTLGDIDSDVISNKNGEWYENLGNSLVNSAIGAAKNLVNNATGGLLGSLFNNKNGVIDSHWEYSEQGKYSFMHYLAAANLLVGDENQWFGSAGQATKPLELQLGYYVQSIDIPQLKIADGGKSTTLIGEFPINGQYVQPDNFNLAMTILNTRLPLIERIFYPWMKEVTMPFWSYNTQPYTTATITIDFNKHTDLKYVFCGCRPTQMQSFTANQENDEITRRQVTFLFDQVYITSELTTMSSIKDKLLGAGSTIFNSAAGMVNL